MSKRLINAFILRANTQEINIETPVDNDYVSVQQIDDDLFEFYQIIGCDCIDITKRQIGNKYYNIICDDEGLFVDNPIITAFHPIDQNQNIFGTIIIVGQEDEYGELTSLTEEDVLNLKSQLHISFVTATTMPKPKMSHVILLS